MLSYARERGLPAVVLNVSNPYGPPDWQPRQGIFVQLAALGRLPCYVRGVGAEVVGIDDAAQAMLLAAERGRVGERYIVSDRFMTQREMVTVAAEAVGAKPPRFGIPVAVVAAVGRIVETIGALTGREVLITSTSVRLLRMTSPADHSKATRELGWTPRPTEESIRRAAEFYVARRQVR